MSKQAGLYNKYHVIRAADYSVGQDVFVLKPKTDPAARDALLAYANATPDIELSNDLLAWLDKLENQ